MKILDTTLREGSYVVNFQFSSRETYTIASKLDSAGVDYIETGHGLGLGASARQYLQPEPDEAYLEATSSAVTKSKWGMFLIPGIGTIEDISLAAKYGMNFIRIGTNVTETAESERYIKHAKDLGLFVFANYMKTYALPVDKVIKLAIESEKYGADNICIVDSAGGMLNDEVHSYVSGVVGAVQIPVSFHGHNNLGLATSNSLQALASGAQVIDTSLRGLGRSAGNVSTEIFSFLLQRKGIPTNVDPLKLLDIAEEHIDDILSNNPQIDSMGIVSGYSKFHSSFETKVMLYSDKYRVDPKKMIIKLTSKDQINAPDYLLDEIGQELSQVLPPPIQTSLIPISLINFRTADSQNGSLGMEREIEILLLKIRSLSIRKNKRSVLNIVFKETDHKVFSNSSVVHESKHAIISSINTTDVNRIILFLFESKFSPDYLLVDSKFGSTLEVFGDRLFAEKDISIITYSDAHLTVQDVIRQIQVVARKNDQIQVHADSVFASRIIEGLENSGVNFLEFDIAQNSELNILVLCKKFPNELLFSNLHAGSIVIDVLAGALDSIQVDELTQKGVSVIRLDIGPALASEIDLLIESKEVNIKKRGQGKFAGVTVSSGNLVCAEGVVVVDDFKAPKQIVGIADGTGLLKKVSSLSTSDIQKIRRLNNFIRGQ
jgi:4-hydroxy-2-oxovalerate aldolase